MEVHHPHHPSHKKKWSEYLLEFFMLFLAVFLGFIAENIRENIAETHQGNEYMHSLVDDIKADTSNAQAVINDFQNRLPHLDSIITHFDDLMKGQSGAVLPNLTYIHAFKDFYVTDGTMQQLKNAGGLRLIKNKDITDSILRYDGATKLLSIQQTHLLNNIFTPLWQLEYTLFDTYKLDSVLHMQQQTNLVINTGDIFLTHDRQKLVQYYSLLKVLHFNFTFWINQLTEFKLHGTRLLSLLQKGYPFEKE